MLRQTAFRPPINLTSTITAAITSKA